MLTINRVLITGRLTRDPETKYLPSGQHVTTLCLVQNKRFTDKSGEWREEAMFIDVVTWDKTAEYCAEKFSKGQAVFVEGKLKQESWERDGVKQSKIKITGESVKPVDSPSKPSESDSDIPHDRNAKRGTAPKPGPNAASNNLDFDTGPGADDDTIPF